MPLQHKFSITTYSHIGNREENQDRFSVLQSPNQQSLLCIVADGMGGHKGGSLAAEAIIKASDTLWQEHLQQGTCTLETTESFLHDLISKSHDEVVAAGKAEGLEPRSTLAALLLFHHSEQSQAISIHAGDSRITQYSSTDLVAKSFDHSLAQLKVLRGKITEEELANDPDQSTVISNIGGQDLPDPEITHWDLSKGDRFTICSDGFWEVFNTADVMSIFETKSEQRNLQIESALFEKMKERPKHDNTTVIMIEIDKSI